MVVDKEQYLKGKKLLILGGIRQMLEVVETAHDMGVLVYVTDYDPNSPCRKVADKSFMVDAIDVDAVVDLCKKEQIDGVITGYVDMLLPYYAEICEKVGLPCYATKEQFNLLTDKKAIKQVCEEYDVPYPKEYSKEDIEKNEISYPVIVKPVDSSGSRGITVCNDRLELKNAIELAVSFSKKKACIVEDYITDGVVLMHYYLQDGEPIFIGMGDSYRQNVGESKIPITSVVQFPSKHTKSFLADTNEKIKTMLQGLNLKNGQLEIESFVKDGVIHTGDIGYRLCGSRLQYLFRSVFGVYSPELLIHFALTGKMANYDIASKVDPLMFGKCGFRLNVLIQPGRIAKIIGKESIAANPSVVGAAWIAQEGDEFSDNDIGRIRQIVCRVYGVAESSNTLQQTILDIYESIDYISTDGTSMKYPLDMNVFR